jgi:hypothetical protein
VKPRSCRRIGRSEVRAAETYLYGTPQAARAENAHRQRSARRSAAAAELFMSDAG